MARRKMTGFEELKRMGFTDEEATQIDDVAARAAYAGMGYRPTDLGQAIIMGRGPIVPMNALDMTIKAADVRKRIEELQNEGQDGGEADRTTHR